MRTRLAAFIGGLLAIVAMLVASSPALHAMPAERDGEPARSSSATPADIEAAASLWHCYIDAWRVCTRIKNAPSSGVKVLDRYTGRVYTLYNGYSVFLKGWWIDVGNPRKCGVNGVKYVWNIGWKTTWGTYPSAVIGDYYLSTGGTATWKPFRVSPYSTTVLGDWYFGEGRGTCDRFPTG